MVEVDLRPRLGDEAGGALSDLLYYDICVYTHILHIYIYIYICIMYVYMYVYMYVCIHMYTYIYIYIYIYTYYYTIHNYDIL